MVMVMARKRNLIAIFKARNAANMSPVDEDSPHESVVERRASDLACILDKVVIRVVDVDIIILDIIINIINMIRPTMVG